MSGSTLSTKGQLVIPARFRKALNLKPGDAVEVNIEDGRLVLRRATPRRANLKRGRFGRPVLVAAQDAPATTTENVIALLEDLP